MVSQENIDNQHESSTYWIIIGAIVFGFLLIARYAMARVARRLTWIRANIRDWIRPIIIGVLIILILIFVGIWIVNLRGKQLERKKKQSSPDSPTK